MVDDYPLITFLKKFKEAGSRPNLGVGFGGVLGISEKLNLYYFSKILLLKIEGWNSNIKNMGIQ